MTNNPIKDFIKSINRQKAENLKLQEKWKDDPAMMRHLKQRYQELCDEIAAKVMLDSLLNDYSGVQMQDVVFNDRKSSKALKS